MYTLRLWSVRHARGLRRLYEFFSRLAWIEQLFVASTHDNVLFFTNTGRVFWKKVYQIPEASRMARGKAIVNLLPLAGSETGRVRRPTTCEDGQATACESGGSGRDEAVVSEP